MGIVNFIKQNKLATLLLLAVLYLLFNRSNTVIPMPLTAPSFMEKSGVAISGSGVANNMMAVSDTYRQSPPPTDAKNRMVISESNLSLQVEDVAKSLTDIRQFTTGIGGYMVESNLNRPEEAASGVIVVRVPVKKMDEALNYYKGLAIKVVSENLNGTDVTDQYVDNGARLAILEKNKARFDEIMMKAVNVDEILRVQQEIFNIQSQIDSIKGQQLYLSKNAEMVRITIYLATDELALPYTPDQQWRPAVVFKEAVRGLLSSAYKLGTALIWIAVYSVIWVPVLLVILFLRRKFGKK